jgi:ubiquinone/menaquinone biosynthesis C-methylase UbiE
MEPKRFETEKKFEDWNEEMARRYDPEAYHERSFILIRWMERMRVNVILAFINSSSNHSVLEVGCGAGNVLERVNSDHRVGIDLSTFLLNKAKKRLRTSASFAMANAEKIPLASAKFDRLICTEVLEHVQSPSTVLGEMARVAKDDAVIVVSIPNEKMIDAIKSIARKLNLASLFSAKKGDYAIPEKMTDEWHLHQFDVKVLKNFLPSYLEVEAIRAIPFFLLPLRYVAKIRLTSRPF